MSIIIGRFEAAAGRSVIRSMLLIITTSGQRRTTKTKEVITCFLHHLLTFVKVVQLHHTDLYFI